MNYHINFRNRKSELIACLWVLLLVQCSSPDTHLESGCNGEMFLQIEGAVQTTVCFKMLSRSASDGNKTELTGESLALTGKTELILLLDTHLLHDNTTHTLQSTHFKLNISGKYDEFYQCNEGEILIYKYAPDIIEASVRAKLSGFYNKKEISVLGKISKYSNQKPNNSE